MTPSLLGLLAALMLFGAGCVPTRASVGYSYYSAPPAVVASQGSYAPAYAEYYVASAPPPPIIEYRPYPPGSEYTWIDGYWDWSDARWVWLHGYWAPPRAGWAFYRPRYEVVGNQYRYVRPYWGGGHGYVATPTPPAGYIATPRGYVANPPSRGSYVATPPAAGGYVATPPPVVGTPTQIPPGHVPTGRPYVATPPSQGNVQTVPQGQMARPPVRAYPQPSGPTPTPPALQGATIERRNVPMGTPHYNAPVQAHPTTPQAVPAPPPPPPPRAGQAPVQAVPRPHPIAVPAERKPQ